MEGCRTDSNGDMLRFESWIKSADWSFYCTISNSVKLQFVGSNQNMERRQEKDLHESDLSTKK